MYGTIILPVAFYGCETWSLTLMEEPGVWVFEKRVTKKIPGPKRAEVNVQWRRLYNEELNDT